MYFMHEGQRLKEVIESTPGCSQSQLARAAGVNRTAVNHWTKMPKFTRKLWANIRLALVKIGVNPSAIRADDEPINEVDENLLPLVESWPDEYLMALRRILDAKESSRDRILAFLTGALRHRTQ
jgi:DNA-binding XRE family transcriptional regulator